MNKKARKDNVIWFVWNPCSDAFVKLCCCFRGCVFLAPFVLRCGSQNRFRKPKYHPKWCPGWSLGGPGRARGYRKAEIGTKRPPRAETSNPAVPFWIKKSPKELPGGPARSHLGIIFSVLSRCVFEVFLGASFSRF